MDQYVTGTMIKKLREKYNITQSELATKLNISDKTVSKWETGKGYPDITLLEPIASAFQISVLELMNGTKISNENRAANMLRTKLYVCPICGNVIQSLGDVAVSCHGVLLPSLEAEEPDEGHQIIIEKIEDYFFLSMEHEMKKDHSISFFLAASSDENQLIKLYPEGNCQARCKMNGVKKIYYYCNKDGLFIKKL